MILKSKDTIRRLPDAEQEVMQAIWACTAPVARTDEYSCAGVPLFRRNGNRQSGGRKPLNRNRGTALN